MKSNNESIKFMLIRLSSLTNLTKAYNNNLRIFYNKWHEYAPRLCQFLYEHYEELRSDATLWYTVRSIFKDEILRAEKLRSKALLKKEIKEAAKKYDK